MSRLPTEEELAGAAPVAAPADAGDALSQMAAAAATTSQPPAPGTPAPPAPPPSTAGSRDPLAALAHIPVRVEVVLGRSRVAVADLLGFAAGSVVVLDRQLGEPVDILANDRLIARGEAVLIDGQLGVTVTQIVQDAP